MSTTSRLGLCFGVALHLGVSAWATGVQAHDQERKTELFNPGVALADNESAQPDGIGGKPALYEGMGSRSFPVTTTSSLAQAYFDQGLTLTWAFNHAEAVRAFRHAQALDPACAMCAWGEAFALGSNINDPMHDAAVAPAWAAISRATELSGGIGDYASISRMAEGSGVSSLEKRLIAALSQRYSADSGADRAVLDAAWASVMRRLAADYPDNVDVQVLFADSLMNLQPWDYWEADGRTPKGNTGELVATLEHALSLDPDHPAAAHLYIHTVEASAEPERAEPYADRLRDAVPAAGHLVHMPAHLYIRVGRYLDALEANRKAIAADEAMLAQIGDEASPLYRFGYYPHNVHFLMVAAQLAGSKEDVLSAAAKLNDVTSDQVSEELAWVQAIKTAPFTAHAQFSEAETILALPDPGDRFPMVKGFWHYARGIAHARAGDLEASLADANAIQHIIETADLSGLEDQYLPARDLLGIARHVVEARVGQARGDHAVAEQALRQAVALQDTIPYMEPPYWYYPVRQTLGSVLLRQGKGGEAVEVFRQALAEQPRNGWALWGLSRALEAAGDQANAEDTKAAFKQAWVGDLSLLTLDRL
jgi:tetratricopeptide (TPR) repeat protein